MEAAAIYCNLKSRNQVSMFATLHYNTLQELPIKKALRILLKQISLILKFVLLLSKGERFLH